jgi:hypothetical protein
MFDTRKPFLLLSQALLVLYDGYVHCAIVMYSNDVLFSDYCPFDQTLLHVASGSRRHIEETSQDYNSKLL